jgi:DNA repair protein RadA/Sms
MAKTKTTYICSACGANFASWAGRCNACGEWNTLEEQIDIRESSRSDGILKSGKALQTVSLDKKVTKESKRLDLGIPDINAVMGGGVVPGSVTLIAGQPGIGKSTLLLQLAYNAAKSTKVLYVSGEESEGQLSLRGQRLKVEHVNLKIASSTNTNDIAATISKGDFNLVVIDSIQTMAINEIAGAPGSISQVTNSTQLLTLAAKKTKTALFLVGHVTKEGSIAGPKVLEHAVDVVLHLEGDRYGGFRILRRIKNRFGSTNEAAILEMLDSGLKVAENPSAALLAERKLSDGSVVLATMEGTRPILVEVQALVNTTSWGYPKRAAVGIDLNKLNLLIATLERRTKLKLSDKDIYINVVGGVKITEPAADLAICMAIASAACGMQLKTDAVVFGEVGLSGEIRHVPWADKRLAEAKKLGFKAAIGPKIIGSNKAPAWAYQMRDVRSALNSFLEKENK